MSEIDPATPALQIDPIFSLVRKLQQANLTAASTLYNQEVLSGLAKDYLNHRDRDFDPGLNIFTVISDLYRRENFHSDIIALLLDGSRHCCGRKFLNFFLTYLQVQVNGKHIDVNVYQNVIIERERSRIDICIKDPVSKKAIIIENKINNAPDMPRQIPGYIIELEKQQYTVEAVVYLVLSGTKQPGTFDWEREERLSILPRLIQLAAFEEKPMDLYNGWLIKCEAIANDIDTLFLLRQYNRLIRSIGGKNMNRTLMESFMQQMLIGDNYQTATALKDMLDDLIFYRRDKIIERYKFISAPFAKVHLWNHYAVLNDYLEGESHFSIDVIVNKDCYQVQLFDRKFSPSSENVPNPAFLLIQSIGMTDEFSAVDQRFQKIFSFPLEEQEMYRFIDRIIEAIRAL